MDVAQVIFGVALGICAVIIMIFAAFVLGTSMWGTTNRWQLRRGPRK